MRNYIIMSGESARAIMDGRKTQTRRVVKPQPVLKNGVWELPGCGWCESINVIYPDIKPLYKLFPYDEYVWVKETWLPRGGGKACIYRANFVDAGAKGVASMYSEDGKWKSPMFMPRSLSRLTLEIMDTHMEKLKDITEDDIVSEGADSLESYARLWDKINAKRGFSWKSNPWVWVIEFWREQ